MRELSLFTGGGGGVWASKLLGHRIVGYVEWNQYCQKLIAQRIRDGIFHNAPIYGDIRAFVSAGYAKRYRGMVDLVSGGFPCQPFSRAGKRLGADDERNMWPATMECIRIIRPRFAFLENVPNLLTYKYFGTILSDLAQSGYDAIWDVFSACEFGAPHPRERLFILAYSNSIRSDRRRQRKGGGTSAEWGMPQVWTQSNATGQKPIQTQIWNTTNPDVLRMADGMANKQHRIRATGNGQVPVVAANAWLTLFDRIGNNHA